ncbi:MAG TPA: serine hydrolase domain-containing protein, partial [Novosphingobium sp.]|nr:serine hydrolase domain-containing protein [Novosphingobium sp.]
MNRIFTALALSLALLSGSIQAEPAPAVSAEQTYAALDADMAAWAKSHDVPGLAWGVVIDGKLAHLGTFGTQTVGADARPVSGDTGFRIASMSKAFTAYAIMLLRDEGKLRLDDPVAKYIPEVARWAPDIAVADLLHHSAGFVTDDPWGDRHQPMSEADFTRLLKAGVPRTAAPETRYEYSNLGYAMLGRIVSNVSGRDFSEFIAERVFSPLGMASTTYEFSTFPAERRAMGYRWEDGAWRAEPVMAHGAFGAMGGITTSANDYARWVSFLLAAWPPASPEDRTG